MLEDHSSRWSAAASPGGLIGLVLALVSLIAAVTSVFSLTGYLDLALTEITLYVILAISSFTTFIFLYLLFGYIRINYRLDPEHLTITWGLWSTSIPYDEIEAVEPASDALDEQRSGWQPFWPGYYVGSWNTDIGKIQAVATLPPRRQILIARADGDIFAISPERPLLFMEELARWYHAFHDSQPEDESQPDAAPIAVTEREVLEEPQPAGAAETKIEPQPPEIAAEPSSEETAPSEPISERNPEPPQVPPPPPGPAQNPAPAFGATSVSDPDERPPELPELDPVPYVPDPEIEIDTSRYPLLPAEPGSADEVAQASPVQQFVDAGWTREYAAVDAAPGAGAAGPPVSVPEHGDGREVGVQRQVLQPLSRRQSGYTSTSPAIRATLHRDPVSLTFIGIGALATAGMAMFILVQYQDIPQSLTLHWNVEGLPGRVGEPREIWVLPIIAALVLLANVGLAWSIALFDRFAARLMLGSTLIVHMITWVALVMLLQ
jgi:hypothetical protein